MTKVAIVGTSILTDLEALKCEAQICDILLKYDAKELLVMSGHAEGVDSLVEQVCNKARIETKIFPPKSKKWDDYRLRNIRIAHECDVLYCITTTSKKNFCYHCKSETHDKTAGCWTMAKAKDLGKKTYLVVIDIECPSCEGDCRCRDI